MKLSREESATTNAKFSISLIADVIDKLSYIDLSNGWTSHIPDFNSIIFLKIVVKDSQPQIEASLTIRSDLYLTAFCQQKYQIDLSMNQVSDIRQIETLLLEIDCLPRPKITRSSEMP